MALFAQLCAEQSHRMSHVCMYCIPSKKNTYHHHTANFTHKTPTLKAPHSHHEAAEIISILIGTMLHVYTHSIRIGIYIYTIIQQHIQHHCIPRERWKRTHTHTQLAYLKNVKLIIHTHTLLLRPFI